VASFQRGIIIDVEGLEEISKLLDRMDIKDARKIIKKANAEGAKFLKPKLQAATPWPSYKRAVRRGPAKRDKPAAIVKYDIKRAPFRHLMVSGSRDHSTRRVRAGKSDIQAFTDGGTKKFSRGHPVRGIRGDDTIRRVADQYGDDALDHVERFLSRQFGLDD
jgi:hypothetical protein